MKDLNTTFINYFQLKFACTKLDISVIICILINLYTFSPELIINNNKNNTNKFLLHNPKLW